MGAIHPRAWQDASGPRSSRQRHGEPLERTIVHELHHALRWRGPGYGRTLGEALVTEGLAGHFAQQLYGGPPEKWESSLDAEGLAQAESDAAAAWDDEAYDHAAWFFGTAPHDGDTPSDMPWLADISPLARRKRPPS
ncbi:DUF2268 domain-containing putative Zn-dependent protease [Rhodovulum sulfidophilum]|uniref:DUF2268 domain-containing putative Zn-dependent protease n=1 Tax=Rhodovulum sulfidophilum TaxID=35806 RepID=UPI00398C4411